MSNGEFERRGKEDKPVLAICYDFDKTLSPDDMQSQGFIQSVGYKDVGEFWQKSNSLAAENDMDQNLAYMLMMSVEAEGNVILKKESLRKYGAEIKLFHGVLDWFERINRYGAEKGVIIEHYIISSGLKEMIEGTPISGYFEKIYASSFYYNEKGVAKWPAQVVNFTNKTQFLFRIEKGVLDINDQSVNDHFAPEDIRVPFRNMVYIGDSDTDIPCMKLVTSNGGYAIGVYNHDTMDKTKVHRMMRDNRIRFFAPTDYSENSELDVLVKAIIDKTAFNEVLENKYIASKQDSANSDLTDSEIKQRSKWIIALDESRNFASTHLIIGELAQYIDKFTEEEIAILLDTAVTNSQVYYILKDYDVKNFYGALLAAFKKDYINADIVREKINEK